MWYCSCHMRLPDAGPMPPLMAVCLPAIQSHQQVAESQNRMSKFYKRLVTSIKKRIGLNDPIKPYSDVVDSTFTQRLGHPKIKRDGKIAVVDFSKDGQVDLATYKSVQEAGNALYLEDQWVGEDHIERMAKLVTELVPAPITFGICHGTRRGNEQKWFRQHIGGDVRVIGTEIADTASAFPDTVQMDFHHRNPEWVGKADFVYSNAWDHSYDPLIAFSTWIESLAPGGIMILDWSDGHSPDAVTVVDPFGISQQDLITLLNDTFADIGKVVTVRPGGYHRYMQIFGIAFQKKTSDREG